MQPALLIVCVKHVGLVKTSYGTDVHCMENCDDSVANICSPEQAPMSMGIQQLIGIAQPCVLHCRLVQAAPVDC